MKIDLRQNEEVCFLAYEDPFATSEGYYASPGLAAAPKIVPAPNLAADVAFLKSDRG